MGILGGMLVSAAGSIAGGAAAGALGAGKNGYSGGGIPGVTATKSSGKGDNMGGIPQVDPTPALAYFKQAATEQEKAYRAGLQFYQDSLKEAAVTVHQSFTAANETLKPLSFASSQALNEQMRFMGLDPLPATSQYGAALSDLSKATGQDFSALQAKINAANKIKDPTERANAKNEILAMAGTTAKSLTVPSNAVAPTMPQLYDLSTSKDKKNTAIMQAHNAKAMSDYNDQLAVYNQAKDTEAANALAAQGLNSLVQDFSTNYTDQYDSAYSGQQVTDKIEATPGYKFQFGQGIKAVQRAQAAKGMLGSGNTLAAATVFGQNMADSYFQRYMDNLSNIVNEGSGATMAIANNQVQEGSYMGQLLQLGGQAAQNTEIQVGNAKAQSLYTQGNTVYDASKFNTQLQFNKQMADKQQSSADLKSVSGLAMNAMNQNNIASVGYGTVLGQQAAVGNINSNTYSTPYGNFTNYSV